MMPESDRAKRSKASAGSLAWATAARVATVDESKIKSGLKISDYRLKRVRLKPALSSVKSPGCAQGFLSSGPIPSALPLRKEALNTQRPPKRDAHSSTPRHAEPSHGRARRPPRHRRRRHGHGHGRREPGAPRRNPAYEQLLTAWRSEQACPEVLPWRGDLVDALLDAAEQQEAAVKATVEQGGDVDECLFSAPYANPNSARCRFVVGSYVRCRLRKLERQCGYNSGRRRHGRLSDAEKTRAVKFLDLIEKHHRASLLDDLPEPFRDERKDGDEACPEVLAKAISKAPALDRFVFVKANKDLGDVHTIVAGEMLIAKGDIATRCATGPCARVLDGSLSLTGHLYSHPTLGAISTSARKTTASSFDGP